AAWIVTKQGFWRDVDDRADLIAATPDLAAANAPDIRLPASPRPQPQPQPQSSLVLNEEGPSGQPA
ncbi:MAG: hypothetical protein ACTHQE_06690, partial [Thermomicrobiales bacterium]